MLVGQRGSYGYGRARGKFAPVRCTLLFSFRPSPRALLVREPCHPPTTVLHPLGPLDPQVPFRHRMSSLRGVSFLSPYLPSVLPGAASRYSRIPVSPPPSPRCIADESIPADILTHWRSMPRSRERRRPQPPTFPTLQPPSRSQTRALGRVGRQLPPLTRPLSDPIVQVRRRDEKCRVHR